MTYLATEMLLYLLAAAVIGVMLGWLVWGTGQRRKLGAIRAELMSAAEQERAAHKATKRSLERSEAKAKEAVERARAEVGQSLEELKQAVDIERLATERAEAALQTVHGDIEAAIREGRETGVDAVDQALRAVEHEKAGSADFRAEIEELRLLVGAEKLAAESARSELAKVRNHMEIELEAERNAHRQAQVALDDIRSTLSRTLGSAAGETGESHAADTTATGGGNTPARPSQQTMPFAIAASMEAAGDALNNPCSTEADIEDWEDDGLDLSSADIEAVTPPGAVVDVQTAGSPKPSGRIEIRPIPAAPKTVTRPAILYASRPDQVDDLCAIDGIGAALEQRLQDAGCYQYSQLAALAPAEINWLAEAVEITPEQIADDRWIEQAKAFLLEIDVGDRDKIAG